MADEPENMTLKLGDLSALRFSVNPVARDAAEAALKRLTEAEGEGWFFRVEIDDIDAFDALLDEAAYSEYVETLD